MHRTTPMVGEVGASHLHQNQSLMFPQEPLLLSIPLILGNVKFLVWKAIIISAEAWVEMRKKLDGGRMLDIPPDIRLEVAHLPEGIDSAPCSLPTLSHLLHEKCTMAYFSAVLSYNELCPIHVCISDAKNRGPLAGDDYAAQLRQQIAMKKQIDAESDDVYDRRSSLRRDGRSYDEGHSKGSYSHAAPEVGNQQSMVRRMADNRHDHAMQAYRTRTESDRERDYRRLQDANDGESNRQQGLTAKNVRAAAAERDRYPSENQRFNSMNRGSQNTNGVAAALRGDDDGSTMQSSKRKTIDPRRQSFSIGWE